MRWSSSTQIAGSVRVGECSSGVVMCARVHGARGDLVPGARRDRGGAHRRAKDRTTRRSQRPSPGSSSTDWRSRPWSPSVPGAAPTSPEDRVATRAHEEAEDDQDQTEDDLTLNELHDPDDDEDHCDEPQNESHVGRATHDVDASHPRVATFFPSPDSSPNSQSLAPFVHLSRGRKRHEVIGSTGRGRRERGRSAERVGDVGLWADVESEAPAPARSSRTRSDMLKVTPSWRMSGSKVASE
jgi:hypothetical protein